MIRQLVSVAFPLLADADSELRLSLEKTTFSMLSTGSSAAVVTAGITIAGLLSNQKDD
jgi:hypothetical protein